MHCMVAGECPAAGILASYGILMEFTPMLDRQAAQETTSQDHHRNAIDFHERAIRHHRQAALLHDCGDPQQAGSHANIACGHAKSAWETGTAALQADGIEASPATPARYAN
jgi:hypothetical protein